MIPRISSFAGLGFEPRYSTPKVDVLPLDDPADYIFTARAIPSIQPCILRLKETLAVTLIRNSP